MQVLVVDPDAAVARALATVALETLTGEPATLVVAIARTARDACAIVDRASDGPQSRLVVLCATRLAEDGSGLDVVRHATQARPDVRVVLLTGGERDGLAEGLRVRVDAIVSKPVDLEPLRGILRFVASGPHPRTLQLEEEGEGVDGRCALPTARAAMEAALEAVDAAERRLLHAGALATQEVRDAVEEARRLAVEAHRRVLDAERALEMRPQAG